MENNQIPLARDLTFTVHFSVIAGFTLTHALLKALDDSSQLTEKEKNSLRNLAHHLSKKSLETLKENGKASEKN